MKIGTRLTLGFTLVVAIILIIVLVSIFFFVSRYRKADFYEHVKERALVAATIYLEEDEMAKQSYARFLKKYQETLPDEIIQIYDEKNRNTFIEKNIAITIPQNIIEKIRKERELSYNIGERQIVGIYYNDNQGDFVIIASAVDTSGFALIRNIGLIILLTFFTTLIVIYFSGRFFARQSLEPINVVVKKVRQITASNLHLRVPEGNGTDEIATLAITFNNMLERLEFAFEMQKTFVSNSSHELRTPLTAIIGNIEVILSKERSIEDYKNILSSVLTEATQMNELTFDLLSLAEINAQAFEIPSEEIRLDELVWEVKEEFEKRYPKDASPIEVLLTNLPDDPTILTLNANRQLLMSAILNIVKNGSKFSSGKPIKLTLTVTKSINIISITDEGIGISHVDLKLIFVPFYRSAEARAFQGHGLGLSLAERVLKLYNGIIEVESVLDQGTTFIIKFPH